MQEAPDVLSWETVVHAPCPRGAVKNLPHNAAWQFLAPTETIHFLVCYNTVAQVNTSALACHLYTLYSLKKNNSTGSSCQLSVANSCTAVLQQSNVGIVNDVTLCQEQCYLQHSLL